MNLAITGMGAVSPIGVTAEEFRRNLLAGVIGIRPAPWVNSDQPDGGLYGAVDDRFDPAQWMDERIIAGTDGFARFALAACGQAVIDAGLDPTALDPHRTGVVHGTSMGGLFSASRAQWEYDRSGPDAVDPKTQ
ncbi:MAG: beta-ketoacyl-[acyl-carrier-protein] synthase family protein, partial [Actinomycetia bacterium]|nr:beta-ketoacyl-[acyl-carrier-protein] synthase family protein [Actinomycetes bacterium]